MRANLSPQQSHHPGFVLYKDHKRKKVVLALRSSEPAASFLTDDPSKNTADFLESYAYAPTVKSTEAIYRLLGEFLIAFKDLHPEYNIVVTGHSMGAAVASL